MSDPFTISSDLPQEVRKGNHQGLLFKDHNLWTPSQLLLPDGYSHCPPSWSHVHVLLWVLSYTHNDIFHLLNFLKALLKPHGFSWQSASLKGLNLSEGCQSAYWVSFFVLNNNYLWVSSVSSIWLWSFRAEILSYLVITESQDFMARKILKINPRLRIICLILTQQLSETHFFFLFFSPRRSYHINWWNSLHFFGPAKWGWTLNHL